MSSTRHSDLQLCCTCCGDNFVYSAGEQELHAVRGIASPVSVRLAASFQAAPEGLTTRVCISRRASRRHITRDVQYELGGAAPSSDAHLPAGT
jgi:hypothetical protein